MQVRFIKTCAFLLVISPIEAHARRSASWCRHPVTAESTRQTYREGSQHGPVVCAQPMSQHNEVTRHASALSTKSFSDRPWPRPPRREAHPVARNTRDSSKSSSPTLRRARHCGTKAVRSKHALETRKFNPRIAPRTDESLVRIVFCPARCRKPWRPSFVEQGPLREQFGFSSLGQCGRSSGRRGFSCTSDLRGAVA